MDEQNFPYSHKVSSNNDVPQLAVTTYPDQEEWFLKPSKNHSQHNLAEEDTTITKSCASKVGCCNEIDNNNLIIDPRIQDPPVDNLNGSHHDLSQERPTDVAHDQDEL